MRLVPLVVVVALIVAGCGAGGRDDGVAPSPTSPFAITVTSRAFTDGGTIPVAYTCNGGGGAPPLAWSGVPAAARSLALVVDDPGATNGPVVHWVLHGLPARDGGLASHRQVPAGAVAAGPGSYGSRGWIPPCPRSSTHYYRFKVLALDAPAAGASMHDVLLSIEDHTIATGWLTGTVSAGQ